MKLTSLLLLLCILRWAPIATYADGTSIKENVYYSVWFAPRKEKYAGRGIDSTTEPEFVAPTCAAGEYWIDAFTLEDPKRRSAASLV